MFDRYTRAHICFYNTVWRYRDIVRSEENTNSQNPFVCVRLLSLCCLSFLFLPDDVAYAGQMLIVRTKCQDSLNIGAVIATRSVLVTYSTTSPLMTSIHSIPDLPYFVPCAWHSCLGTGSIDIMRKGYTRRMTKMGCVRSPYLINTID